MVIFMVIFMMIIWEMDMKIMDMNENMEVS